MKYYALFYYVVDDFEVRSWTVVIGNEPPDAHPMGGVR